MNKRVKLLSVLLIAVMLISVFANVAMAVTDPGTLKGTDDATATTKITGIGNRIISVITTIGSVVSVIVLIVLGLKYMIGSAEEKAEYKKTLLPYLIGAALVFAASGIASVVFNFTKNLQ